MTPLHQGAAVPRRSEAGFTLIDSMIATSLLVVGVLGAAVTGISCSNLQQEVRDYSAANMVAADIIDRLRTQDPNTIYAQYTASPVSTSQGQTVTVEFPQEVLDQVYHGTLNVATARASGLLPVRITIRKGRQRYQFSTFVGQS